MGYQSALQIPEWWVLVSWLPLKQYLCGFRATDDGLCAVDISTQGGADFDTIIPTDLKLNARAVLEICVHTTPNQGGIATNLGQNGALAVRITPYRPNVQCKAPGSAPPPMTCRKLLDLMPTDGIQRRYGRPDDPTAQVDIPKRFTTPEARCVLLVNTASSTDISDWYKLWAAAMAVEVMCVEARGAGGVASGLGRSSSSSTII